MKTIELTIITRRIVKVEVQPCIHCGGEDIYFDGRINPDEEIVHDPVCKCEACGEILKIPNDVVFKNMLEHYEYWNKANDPKNRIEVLKEKQRAIQEEIDKLMGEGEKEK